MTNDTPNTSNQTQTQNIKEPIDRKSDAGITASIWENKGKYGKFHNVTISRSYKDADGNYHSTDSFRKQDLPVLMEVLRDAYGSIRTLEQNKKKFVDNRDQRNQRSINPKL